MSGDDVQPANGTSGFWNAPTTRLWFGTAGILAVGLIAGGYLLGDGLRDALDPKEAGQ